LVEPDLVELALEPRDVFVLCSDGLTNHVEDHEIAKWVCGGEELQETCEQLIDLANSRGGEDNSTVLLARCEKND
jgi:protein phosphatase